MPLPAVIQEIVRAIGHGKAMDLVQAFGGQEIRIPRAAGSESWYALAEVIGAAAANTLATEMGGGDLVYIALCSRSLKADRNRKMISRYDALLRDGNSGFRAVAILVREFAPISNRQVKTILNSPQEAPGGAVQALLF